MTSRLLILLWLYGAFVNGFLLLHLILFDSVALLKQLNVLAHWITLFSLIALAIAVLLRAPRLALWLSVGALAFIVWYSGDFLPKSMPQASENEPLTLLSFNIWGSRANSADVAEILRDESADIVALQELQPRHIRYFRDELAELYPYQVYRLNSRLDINGILSRYPILDDNRAPEYDYARPSMALPRHLRAEIELANGQRVAVYNFHPMRPRFRFFIDYNDRLNTQNYDQLLADFAEETLPILLLCDCNAPEKNANYRRLDARLEDAHRRAGWGFGLTHSGLPISPFRLTRIDYIWYDPQFFAATESRVIAERARSDHSPIWARLAVR